MSDQPPLTKAQLLDAVGLWHTASKEVTNDNEDAYFAWMKFVDERGGELLALAIAAVGRLGPKEARGPYGQRMLGQTQQKIVDAVAERPLTVSEIAAALGLNYQNTRRMLPVLEVRGLIHKGHCPIKAAQVWSAVPFATSAEAPATDGSGLLFRCALPNPSLRNQNASGCHRPPGRRSRPWGSRQSNEFRSTWS